MLNSQFKVQIVYLSLSSILKIRGLGEDLYNPEGLSSSRKMPNRYITELKLGNSLRGFTLIELLLVVSITLTLGVLSTVFYSRFLTQNSVANIQERLLGSLRKAQFYTISAKRQSNWGVHYDGNRIILFQGSSYAGRNPALDEIFVFSDTLTISGFSDIIFTGPKGSPSSTPMITINGPHNENARVVVNSQGVASRN